ncbi:MAG TPA: hypothetical protein VHF27_07840 [Acidimicrobiales bacterium]|nr:hypothetical protein [Acidimicrobiales bacterium]
MEEKVVPRAAEVSRALTRSVTRVSRGATASCKVDDPGSTVATGRLIDLSLDNLEKLAHPDTGLVDATIDW